MRKMLEFSSINRQYGLLETLIYEENARILLNKLLIARLFISLERKEVIQLLIILPLPLSPFFFSI